MSLRQDDFQTGWEKVGFISLLTGPAAQWVTLLLTQPSQLLDDYTGFHLQMKAMFKDPVKAQTANRRLHELKQGHRPITEYISDFRLISQDYGTKRP